MSVATLCCLLLFIAASVCLSSAAYAAILLFLKACSVKAHNHAHPIILLPCPLLCTTIAGHRPRYNPDFVKMVEAMGCKGMYVDNAADLPAVMKEFLDYRGGPVLLNAKVRGLVPPLAVEG